MDALLRFAQDEALFDTQLDVLVLIGCGRIRNLPQLESWASRLVFVDADPRLEDHNLATLTNAKVPCTYHLEALMAEEGIAKFYRYNFPGYNGVIDFTGANGAPPNLQLVTCEEVSAVCFGTLFELEGIAPNIQQVGILIDIPNVELSAIPEGLQLLGLSDSQLDKLGIRSTLGTLDEKGLRLIEMQTSNTKHQFLWFVPGALNVEKRRLDEAGVALQAKHVLNVARLNEENRVLEMEVNRLNAQLDSEAELRKLVNIELGKCKQQLQIERDSKVQLQREFDEAVCRVRTEHDLTIERFNKVIHEHELTLTELRTKLESEVQQKKQANLESEGLKQKLRVEREAYDDQRLNFESIQNVLTEENLTLKDELQGVREALAAEVKLKQEAVSEADNLKIQLKTQLDTHTQEHSTVQSDLKSERAKLDAIHKKLVAEERRREELENENKEILTRQQLMNEELLKAEAQIELIKDLVLRDQDRL